MAVIKEEILSLQEIKERLSKNELPISGETTLRSAKFKILRPAFYAGIALHTGRCVRPELLKKMAVSDRERYRDEDPYTDLFIQKFPIQIIACDSRFEYDLNRDRESCVYEKFKKKWNLKVWNDEPAAEEKELSHKKFDEFFTLVDLISNFLLQQSSYAVIFDMHSFCFQRYEQKAWHIDEKPEINVGTMASNRELFKPLIDDFINLLKRSKIENHQIRVAENKLFPGGYLSRRIAKNHYSNILTLALEYKKIFMDELSGEFYPGIFGLLKTGFEHAVARFINRKHLILYFNRLIQT